MAVAGAAHAQVWRCPGGVYQDEPCRGGAELDIRPEDNAMQADDRVWTPGTSTIMRDARGPYIGGISTEQDRSLTGPAPPPVLRGYGYGLGYHHPTPHFHRPPLGRVPPPRPPQPAPEPLRGSGGYYWRR